ncbi:MAG TPA: hypothetical protein VHB69_02330 [Mycobacteriales bacterium]|nr:hypothetical protein [Mycobacteriales bacterium]
MLAAHVDHSDEDQDFLGLPGLLTAEQTAALLARRDEAHRRRATQDELFGVPRDTSWQSVAGLRKEINELARKLAARKNLTPAAAHGLVRRAVPGPESAKASEEILAARRDWLMEQVF